MTLRFLLLLFFICCSCKNNSEKTNAEKTNIYALTTNEKISAVSKGNQSPNSKIKTIDGSIIDTESFRGKLLVIDFWATWCSPCIKEAPIFRKIAKKYKNSNVEFVSISIDGEFSNWKDYIIRANWEGNNYWCKMRPDNPFSYLLYSKSNLKDKYAIGISLPKYVIISPQGEILSNSDLRPSKPEFEMEIKKYLK